MQWSIWSAVPEHQYRVLGDTGGGEGVAGGVVDNHTMIASTLDTLQIHQVRKYYKESELGGCYYELTVQWVSHILSQDLC